MNVDNIKYLFCLFMNNLTSLSCELARLAIYQPREFLSVWANYGHWMLLAVKQTVESACGAGILCRKAAKRASGRSNFLKVSFLTDDQPQLKPKKYMSKDYTSILILFL